jgi:hypothetical protein
LTTCIVKSWLEKIDEAYCQETVDPEKLTTIGEKDVKANPVEEVTPPGAVKDPDRPAEAEIETEDISLGTFWLVTSLNPKIVLIAIPYAISLGSRS